ncbi:hypothetical protein BRADI_2g22295v3 [Brachypodium distachyon]|uniref:Myb-like domain-containing protein n=1 Tax=Brachypodium distachyon TaxID=15368 RepID=A0A2K2D9W5_BRADI|nr:hypothetical protein BRADI_2g22295v3 [Brachypodium distachyon]
MDGAPRNSAPAAVHADAAVARKIPNPESLKRKERCHRAAEAKKSQEDATARALAAAKEEDAIVAEAAHNQQLAAQNQQLAAQQALFLYNRQAVAAAFAQQAAVSQSSGNRLPRSMSPPVSSPTYGSGPAMGPFSPCIQSPEVGDSMSFVGAPSALDLNAMNSPGDSPMMQWMPPSARDLPDGRNLFSSPSPTAVSLDARNVFDELSPTNEAYYDDEESLQEMIRHGGQQDGRQEEDEDGGHSGQQDDELDGEENGEQDEEFDYMGKSTFEEELAQVASETASRTKRTGSYTEDEDKLLCDAWLTIGQDPIARAEQKGGAYWKRIHEYFHKYKSHIPYSFESDRNENSLTHRWQHILAECNKYTAAYNSVKNRPVSGVGMASQVIQAMDAFRAMNNGKKFNLSHCWIKLHKAPKWIDLVASLKIQAKNAAQGKKRSNDGIPIDLEAGEISGGLGKRSDRPQGKKLSKDDLKREASTIALQESLKEMVSVKEASSGKRGEIRELKKDERFKSFMDMIQEKYRGDATVATDLAAAAKLDATPRAKEVELKMLMEENRIIRMDLSPLDDVARAWYIKKKKEIADQQT